MERGMAQGSENRKDAHSSPRPSPLTPRLQRAESALVIFAKAPIPGEVKTRLCPPLTPDEAATLHGSFVLDMLERTKLAVTILQLPCHRYLACAPSSELVFFKIMEERQGVRLLDQVGEDVGQRMHHTFTDLFAKGYKQVILVGTDVPTLPLSVYQEAFAILGRSDVVLGPALDGGYYLIGLTTADRTTLYWGALVHRSSPRRHAAAGGDIGLVCRTHHRMARRGYDRGLACAHHRMPRGQKKPQP